MVLHANSVIYMYGCMDICIQLTISTTASKNLTKAFFINLNYVRFYEEQCEQICEQMLLH